MDIAALERMIDRGQDGAMLRFTLGNACAGAGRWPEAAGHYARALDYDPAYSAAWQALYKALDRSGAPARALREVAEQGVATAREQGDMQVVRALEARLRRLGGSADG